MATPAQQQQFVTTWSPYANQAGARLGVNPAIIMGQWANESGWGTQGSAALTGGNVAGINVPGSTTGTNYASFNSPQAFTDTYVNTIQTNFPNAMNTGASASAFNQGLVNGRGGRMYYTSDPNTYQNNVISGANTALQYNPGLASGDLQYTPQGPNVAEGTGGTDASGQGFTPVIESGGPSTVYNPNAAPGEPGSEFAPAGNTTVSGGNTGTGTGTTGGSSGGFLGGLFGGGGAGNTAASGEASAPGYLPPILSGGPAALGLTPGLAQGVGGWITNAENYVGQAFKNAWAATLGQITNIALRFFLILAGLVIIAIALWRLMAPDVSAKDLAGMMAKVPA